MQKIKYSLLALAVMFALAVQGQETKQPTMAELLRNTPSELFPYLSKNNILNLIDYCEAGQKGREKNMLRGETTMDTLTVDYARLLMNEAVVVEMKLLSPNVICMVTTYGNPAASSVIKFFDSEWQRITGIANPLDVSETMATATLSPDNLTLTITPTGCLMSREEKELAANQLMQTNLKWNGTAFK